MSQKVNFVHIPENLGLFRVEQGQDYIQDNKKMERRYPG